MIQAVVPKIAVTLARAGERLPYFGATYGAVPDGWVRACDVVSDPVAVADLLDQVCTLYTIDDRQVAASFLVMGYFWYPMFAALACYRFERRVPDLGADAFAMRAGHGIRFLSPHFSAFADDPAASDPHVEAVADHAALRRAIVLQLEQEHAVPLFATLRTVAPYGVNAMRANYVDRMVSAILYIAELVGDWDFAREETPEFLSLMQAKSRAGLIEVECAERRQPFQRRSGCCLNYRLPGLEKCDTCSLRPADERLRLFQQYLEDASNPTA